MLTFVFCINEVVTMPETSQVPVSQSLCRKWTLKSERPDRTCLSVRAGQGWLMVPTHHPTSTLALPPRLEYLTHSPAAWEEAVGSAKLPSVLQNIKMHSRRSTMQLWSVSHIWDLWSVKLPHWLSVSHYKSCWRNIITNSSQPVSQPELIKYCQQLADL